MTRFERAATRQKRYAPGLIAPDGTSALLTPEAQRRVGAPAFLKGVSDDEATDIISVGTQRVLDRDAVLFKQGSQHDGIFLIESGRIKVFYTAPSGQELTLAYWHPGHFVGGPDVFEGGRHVWSGVAARNSTVLQFSGSALRRLIAKVPALGVSIIEGLVFKGRCYSGMAQMLGTRSATERLAHVLLHLADLYGVPENRGIVIAEAFSHADLANMIGVTRQWVTVSLNRFAKAGLVGTHQSNLVIMQPSALALMKGGRDKAP